MDYGHELTDKNLKALEKKIQKEYSQASKEAEQKMRDYLDRFSVADKKMSERLNAGEITKDEYLKWRTTNIALGDKWKGIRDDLTATYMNADKVASDMIKDSVIDTYALNHNYGTYEIEKGIKADTGYDLYDRDTVKRLMKDDPKLLHAPGKETSEAIRAGKLKRWNQQNVQSALTQGLLQGESMPKIANRLAKSVGQKNMNAAIRDARTMTTGAENAGRIDSYNRAQEMGIEVKARWMATLDNRTRHSHALMDGEVIGEDGTFSNGCKFPGDPDGDPEEVYNCRCTLVGWIEGVNDDLFDIENRITGEGFTNYEDWQAKHKRRRQHENSE